MTTAKSPLSAIPCEKEWDKPVTVAARSSWLGLCVNVRKTHTNRSAWISLIWAEEKYMIEIEERRRKRVEQRERGAGTTRTTESGAGMKSKGMAETEKKQEDCVCGGTALEADASTRIRGATNETPPPYTITQLHRHVVRVHDREGRHHWGAEDGAGEGILHVPAVRNGERLGSVLSVRRVCCGRRNGTVGRGGVQAGAEAGGVETAEWSREEAADGEGEPEWVGREAGTRGIHMESGVYSKLGGRGIGRGRPTEVRIIRENAGDVHGKRRKVVGGREAEFEIAACE
ncbi:hypothetical protein B0H13DRAFT_1913295 [Mycena leptocephala]|nr:hypothetical protein B0H13DRAFT_1913295 [Mycena leptocephala]